MLDAVWLMGCDGAFGMLIWEEWMWKRKHAAANSVPEKGTRDFSQSCLDGVSEILEVALQQGLLRLNEYPRSSPSSSFQRKCRLSCSVEPENGAFDADINGCRMPAASGLPGCVARQVPSAPLKSVLLAASAPH